MKQYLGIISSIIYALAIRIIAEFDIIEINSLAFLIVAPTVLGFIPFFFRNDKFYNSIWKAIFFPLISILIFLLIAVATRIEDIFCLAIIGFPYVFISILVSIGLYFYLKKQDNGISKNTMSILLLPILVGSIEKEFPKKSSEYIISENIIINSNLDSVYNNLLEVPDLSETSSSGISNYLGIPRPKFSTYDYEFNIRKGYFENGIVLYETVKYSKTNSKLVFNIDVDKSELANSPTLNHVLTSKGIEFDNVTYKLSKIDSNKTKLTLSTKFNINSNLPFYGRYWSKLIITDFETNILRSLKAKIE
ncbi:MAG: hypothetical protein V4622_07790 [Bacteroidota bacterium]